VTKIGVLSVVFPLLAATVSGIAMGQAPDHPVITEVYQEPLATGGPVGRDPADPHQEFIEIYLPTLADLDPGLNKDALNLTIYDVEGDFSSPGLSLVNYRIDLPTFDLDPGNGLAGLPRPASGVVVLGWVDYVGNPATGLAGTPATRVALINGGVTSTTDFTFIAINGSHFSGTTNFPVPVAVSHIDTVSDPVTGKIEQGSGVFLLVDRDDPGYVSLCSQTDPLYPGSCSAFPNLPGGTILGTSSLLDSFAANDDAEFRIGEQPYDAPTGDDIDLEFVLPLGGAFSLLAPQVPEEADGYRRLLVDIVKTTEDGIGGNEDPILDATDAYRPVSNIDPFRPTPGWAPSTTSAAALSLGDASLQNIEVLTNTNAHPGLVAANVGGDFGMDTTTTPGATSDPTKMTVVAASGSFGPLGQVLIAPPVEVQTFASTPAGHIEVINVQVDATPATGGDPPVVNPSDSVLATFTAIDPTTGRGAFGQPFQATAFIAVQGIPDVTAVANEFASTSLAQAMAAGLGSTIFDTLGNGLTLVNPLTDISDHLVIDPMIASIPTDPLAFINPVGATADLVTTVSGSPEVATGTGTYDLSFNAGMTLVQAREFAIPEVATSNGFTPTERVHYADRRGFPGRPTSGLTDVLTGRDFELALIDTQVGFLGLIETGATDDFGIVVRVGQTATGASVVPGEYLFLSMTGGLAGADVDTLDVAPHGNLMAIVYVDLDNLDSVLGVETIDRLFVIDGSGSGELDVVDVVTLPEPAAALSLCVGWGFLALCNKRRKRENDARAHYST